MSDNGSGEPDTVRRKQATRGVAALVSAGAVACGICCALPFALPAVALAGSGGALAWFGGAQGALLILGVVLVLLAWLWIGVTSARSKRRPARSTMIAMSVVTLVLTVGIAVQIEALLC